MLVTDGDIAAELDRLGQTRCGAWHRGSDGTFAPSGCDLWKKLQLEVTLNRHPESPVKRHGRHLVARLPATLGFPEFWWDLHAAVDLIAIYVVMRTSEARERSALLGLDTLRYWRLTARTPNLIDAAIDLVFFRAHLDADALMSLVEGVISAHLLGLAHGRDASW